MMSLPRCEGSGIRHMGSQQILVASDTHLPRCGEALVGSCIMAREDISNARCGVSHLLFIDLGGSAGTSTNEPSPSVSSSHTTKKELANTQVVLPNPSAAQGVPRPPCLLLGLAAHLHVRPAETRPTLPVPGSSISPTCSLATRYVPYSQDILNGTR